MPTKSTQDYDLSNDLDVKIYASHVETQVGFVGTAAPLRSAGARNSVETYRSYTPEFARDMERKLVRKIDSRMMPFVVIIYLFNYLDRNSITQARLYGLQEDTHVRRWLFILEGLVMVVVGITGYFVIPDYPGTTEWLSEEEKIVAQGRLAADAGSEDGNGEDEVTIWQDIAWALKDRRGRQKRSPHAIIFGAGAMAATVCLISLGEQK